MDHLIWREPKQSRVAVESMNCSPGMADQQTRPGRQPARAERAAAFVKVPHLSIQISRVPES